MIIKNWYWYKNDSKLYPPPRFYSKSLGRAPTKRVSNPVFHHYQPSLFRLCSDENCDRPAWYCQYNYENVHACLINCTVLSVQLWKNIYKCLTICHLSDSRESCCQQCWHLHPAAWWWPHRRFRWDVLPRWEAGRWGRWHSMPGWEDVEIIYTWPCQQEQQDTDSRRLPHPWPVSWQQHCKLPVSQQHSLWST